MWCSGSLKVCGVYGASSSCRYGAQRLLARLVVGSTCRSGTRRGLTVFVACLPCLLLAFLPPSPQPPSQREGGDFCYLMQGASPLASPGAGGARHWLGFEETIRLGIAGGRRLQLQSITNSRKVLGGLGASFKKPPNVSPPLASPGLAGRGTGLVLRKQFGLVSPEDAGYSYSQ